MDAMKYFIKRFVDKNRQERWFYLLGRGFDKFFENIGQMERCLNEKCTLIEKDSTNQAQRVINEKGIVTGLYYGQLEQNKEISLASLDDFLNNCEEYIWGRFIICRPEKIAFYLHHEGWIWICRE